MATAEPGRRPVSLTLAPFRWPCKFFCKHCIPGRRRFAARLQPSGIGTERALAIAGMRAS
jgi:hypothetical protein